ncbi:DUF2778 domain-containing protein [Allorhizobium sonneratiae]|uniref:DUF2778 domain-containing protein n=1 Tax=Allorhizobium sonneratiae TaxID=2934936 RepID=UPI002033ACA6|nr:DUF2778 domain-containing protein [Allorhizobium sonneratiae]
MGSALLSGAALAGGGLAAGLWLATAFGALHGLKLSPGPTAEAFTHSFAEQLHATLVLPKPPQAAVAIAPPSLLPRRIGVVRPQDAGMRTDRPLPAVLVPPKARSLDASGHAIIKQALSAAIAERALSDRWSEDTGQAVAQAAEKAAKAEQEALAAAKIAAEQMAQQQVAMLPDVAPAPIGRPESDPFREVMSARQQRAPETAPAKPVPERPSRRTLLAYARPEEPSDGDESPSLFGRRASLPGRGSGIAVYDISKATVYLPDGEKLEAHSGVGAYRDNPRSVHVKNLGATPPNIYRLTLRESLFHGIEALRMTPVGDNRMYGRDGFLTHTFMLRVRGDSNGCVVFKNYPRFLAAYKRGEVKTLIVVPSINQLPTYMAKL